MVDNTIISKPLQSLSSTKRVKPVGHRQNNNQQNMFKETFKARQKKKRQKKIQCMLKYPGGAPRQAEKNIPGLPSQT